MCTGARDTYLNINIAYIHTFEEETHFALVRFQSSKLAGTGADGASGNHQPERGVLISEVQISILGDAPRFLNILKTIQDHSQDFAKT